MTEQPTETNDTLKTAIIDALKTVYDPEIPVNIYDLGLIYDILIDAENNVQIHMTLTAPGCPVAGTFPQMVSDSITSHVSEVKAVNVELVWDPPWGMDRMSEAARLQLGIFD